MLHVICSQCVACDYYYYCGRITTVPATLQHADDLEQVSLADVSIIIIIKYYYYYYYHCGRITTVPATLQHADDLEQVSLADVSIMIISSYYYYYYYYHCGRITTLPATLQHADDLEQASLCRCCEGGQSHTPPLVLSLILRSWTDISIHEMSITNQKYLYKSLLMFMMITSLP